MNLQAFINALQHDNPLFRLNAARSLGMVAEVDAFEPMGAVFQRETDPEAKSAMHWAGKEILKAKKAGVTTLDRIFDYFKINDEITHMPDANEAKLMKTMQDNLDRDLLKMKQDGLGGKAGLTLAAGIAGAAVGGITGAAAAAAGAGMQLARDNSRDYDRSLFGSKRVPATAPTNGSIKIWSQRLLSDPNPQTRIQATRELLMINNPAAVPNLATAYLNDPDQEVRDQAYRAGVELYLRMRYWALQQEGIIDAEFEKRAQAAGKLEEKEQSGSTPPFTMHQEAPVTGFTASDLNEVAASVPPAEDDGTGLEKSTPEEIAEILRKAEENRAKRGRRR